MIGGSALEQTESETEALRARAEALETLMKWPSLDSAEALPADDVLRAVVTACLEASKYLNWEKEVIKLNEFILSL